MPARALSLCVEPLGSACGRPEQASGHQQDVGGTANVTRNYHLRGLLRLLLLLLGETTWSTAQPRLR